MTGDTWREDLTRRGGERGPAVQAHDRVSIDRQVQRLAYADVVERWTGCVEHEEVGFRGRIRVELTRESPQERGLEVSRDGIVAPYNAPGTGPPPWQVYRVAAHAVFGVATAEPYGATRWRW